MQLLHYNNNINKKRLPLHPANHKIEWKNIDIKNECRRKESELKWVSSEWHQITTTNLELQKKTKTAFNNQLTSSALHS